jgi:hypothetical protein
MKLYSAFLIILSLPIIASADSITSSLSYNIDGLTYSNFTCDAPSDFPIGAPSCGALDISQMVDGIQFTTPGYFKEGVISVFYDVSGPSTMAALGYSSWVNAPDSVFVSEVINDGLTRLGQNYFVGGYNPNNVGCSLTTQLSGTNSVLAIETDIVVSGSNALVSSVANVFWSDPTTNTATPEPGTTATALMTLGLVGLWRLKVKSSVASSKNAASLPSASTNFRKSAMQ